MQNAEIYVSNKLNDAKTSDEVFVFPSTIGQKGFWFLDQMNPGNPAYNIAVRFRLRGPLNVSTLKKAFNSMVLRHESLRTAFAEIEDQAV